ncbi:hypothetical protein CB7_134 [Pectobacterium phage vB_PatM_CB7]|uniref:Uncharacterized protein n=2 Tax=root TaxID=1 RepID=K9L3R8_9CAUD|nr:hypothetical protein phiTE_088 [Pectobacterium phage phiTE]AEZ66254.1 hypothetical protein phiTE_088 [Pectobacterium phage phiTE]ARB11608.1 hypothetical protein CB7_134 [Pectobacterium phage vB_PatM_CB7]
MGYTMQNLYSMTEFIRLLAGRPMGFTCLYLVTDGKGYRITSKSLAAIAAREGVKISTAQALIVDPATVATIEAIRVTVK